MVNKANAEYAYTMIDTQDIAGLEELETLENVIRVRVIK